MPKRLTTSSLTQSEQLGDMLLLASALRSRLFGGSLLFKYGLGGWSVDMVALHNADPICSAYQSVGAADCQMPDWHW